MKRYRMQDENGNVVVLSNNGVAGVTSDPDTYEANGHGGVLRNNSEAGIRYAFMQDKRFENLDRDAYEPVEEDADA